MKDLSTKTVNNSINRLTIKPLPLMLLALLAFHSIADEPPKGWRWYNETKAPKVPPKEEESLPPNSVSTVMSATEQMQ
ncbi:hypothetical protein AB4395_23775, partial [Vibrio splendidus]